MAYLAPVLLDNGLRGNGPTRAGHCAREEARAERCYSVTNGLFSGHLIIARYLLPVLIKKRTRSGWGDRWRALLINLRARQRPNVRAEESQDPPSGSGLNGHARLWLVWAALPHAPPSSPRCRCRGCCQQPSCRGPLAEMSSRPPTLLPTHFWAKKRRSENRHFCCQRGRLRRESAFVARFVAFMRAIYRWCLGDDMRLPGRRLLCAVGRFRALVYPPPSRFKTARSSSPSFGTNDAEKSCPRVFL